MLVQSINRHNETTPSNDDAKSKIYEAIKRARCTVQVGLNRVDGELGEFANSDRPADVRVLVVTEYSEIHDAVRGCLVGSTEVPIVVYLVVYDEVTELLALRAGASDVLRPDMTVRVMAERIMLAQSHDAKSKDLGKHKTSPSSHCKPAIWLDESNRIVELRGRRIQMTTTELSLLQALNTHDGQVVSREELLKAVGTETSRSDTRACDSHIKRLRMKFAEAGFPRDIIKTVYGVGYRLDLER